MDDRAVSELVGYVILFGMVVLVASTIVVVGTSTLADSRDREQINNAEAAFEILAGNIDDQASDRAVGRSTEIRVSSADLYFGAEEEFTVSVTPDGGTEQVYLMEGEPIVYESEHGSKVVYSNGALFRETDQESRMVTEPGFKVDTERTVLPHTSISGSDQYLSIGGSETVLVRTEQRTPRFYQNITADTYEIEIEVVTESARATTWEGYLETHDELDCETNEISDERSSVTCDPYTTSELYIPETRLSGEFS
ncbi:DUF7289 family protein [Natronococcus wangiae]|uniref:DUF7289 family protein n=1 Tax=Natronococcus wangiae TaxID=3068275 RepID=UPI00273DD7F7|nr:hypothetical protein [Natronococcus sp. AD5]